MILKKVSIWDKLSKKYDSLWVQKYSLTPTRKKVLSILKRCKSDFSMLDVGCATGQLLSEVRNEFSRSKLFGIDKSEQMIELARSKNIDAKFDCVYAEEYDTKIKFDVVTCCHSFPYYQEKELVLKKVASLLNENGMAIFIQGSINGIYDRIVMSIVEMTAEKANYLSKKEFINQAKEYFVIEESFLIKEKWFMPSICGFVLRRKL
ncbi:class I SAM-dependent DNA methyltransferase [Acetivibrio cellulolyticus]|uniref:class I SAM-dependent DNA methyltransferase n=1 Tax=Acetivibrio cellulolyticus TaxID=35830 RepID=UPI0001E305B4|nr:class I SAM-dependent methyltransferase [Acetivibrio cellulolyticus]